MACWTDWCSHETTASCMDSLLNTACERAQMRASWRLELLIKLFLYSSAVYYVLFVYFHALVQVSKQAGLVMQELLRTVFKCVLCGNAGTLANNAGVRCHGCHLYMHQICIDPLRRSEIDTVVNGKATLWMCDDCADVLEGTLDREDEGVNVDDVDDGDECEEGETDIDDSGDSGDSDDCASGETTECTCCTCNDGTELRRQKSCDCLCTCDDDADEDDAEADDFIETPEETAAKLRRGETVWSRSTCPCQVCVEMNRAVDQWPQFKEFVARTPAGNPMTRAVIKAVSAADEAALAPGLDNILAMAGLPSMTPDEVSRRGRL
jgi:hypothetical protein